MKPSVYRIVFTFFVHESHKKLVWKNCIGQSFVLWPFVLSKLYFTIINGNSPRIFRINLNNGGGLTIFASGSGLRAPNDLDIDFEDNRLMWSDYTTGSIQGISLNGGALQNIRSKLASFLKHACREILLVAKVCMYSEVCILASKTCVFVELYFLAKLEMSMSAECKLAVEQFRPWLLLLLVWLIGTICTIAQLPSARY